MSSDMKNETTNGMPISAATDKYAREQRRKRRIRNAKVAGDTMMYIGCAGMMQPFIQRARQEQNGVMRTCITGAGIVLSLGAGRLASNILEKTIDKCVSFWDDVKPNSAPEKKKEDAENG